LYQAELGESQFLRLTVGFAEDRCPARRLLQLVIVEGGLPVPLKDQGPVALVTPDHWHDECASCVTHSKVAVVGARRGLVAREEFGHEVRHYPRARTTPWAVRGGQLE